jgi:hypothetical protein
MAVRKAKAVPAGGKTGEEVLQFRVTLLEIRPEIWRRILLPIDANFHDLHLAIQGAFAWLNYHLHAFEVGTRRLEDTSIEDAEEEEERDVLLTELFRVPKSVGLYEYDFGDDWNHEVLFEGRVPRGKYKKLPVCTAGARAGPPEDCGGTLRLHGNAGGAGKQEAPKSPGREGVDRREL